MAYNRRYIQKRPCKHKEPEQCTNMPKIGANGFCYLHEKEDPLYEDKKKKKAAKNAEKKIKLPNSGNIPTDQVLEIDKKVNKEKWFRSIRPLLTGKCTCGCGQPSSKFEDRYFRHSIAHIFPKAYFESVMFHPLNYVERAFWGGCHSVMDDTSIQRWPLMADWSEIREKFFILAPLLTKEERSRKFYSNLERLVYEKM